MTATPPTGPDSEASFLEVTNLILRGRRTIVQWAFGGAVVFAVISLIIPPTYVAHTAFIQAEPARGLLSGSLGALASRFGVGAGAAGEAALSLDYLQQTLLSQDVLDSVLLHPLYVARPAKVASGGVPRLQRDTVEIGAFLGIDDRNPAKRLDKVRRKALKKLSVGTDQKSGIVRVSAGLRDPYVAAAFVRALEEALNQFNLHTRQTVSRANRGFLEVRTQEAKDQLGDAEGHLRQFYETNRRIADAPGLQFEEGRLKRQVDLAQQIYLTLAQQLEQARIDEVKDTPVLTVIETATPPVRKTSPKRTILTLMGGFVGAVLALLSMLVKSQMRQAATTDSPAWEEFLGHLRGMRLLRRRKDGGSAA